LPGVELEQKWEKLNCLCANMGRTVCNYNFYLLLNQLVCGALPPEPVLSAALAHAGPAKVHARFSFFKLLGIEKKLFKGKTLDRLAELYELLGVS
jgi:hypothetical protein